MADKDCSEIKIASGTVVVTTRDIATCASVCKHKDGNHCKLFNSNLIGQKDDETADQRCTEEIWDKIRAGNFRPRNFTVKG